MPHRPMESAKDVMSETLGPGGGPIRANFPFKVLSYFPLIFVASQVRGSPSRNLRPSLDFDDSGDREGAFFM